MPSRMNAASTASYASACHRVARATSYSTNFAFVVMVMETMMANMPRADAKISMTKI